jgi:restriction system protein
MPVSTYDKFSAPILRYLAAHPDGASARRAHEAAAEALGLREANRQELLPSGVQPVYKMRCGWRMTASNGPACQPANAGRALHGNSPFS